MRLSMVALLGIEITIISLASAASAATHPDGPRAEDSMNESGPGFWQDGPENWRPSPDAAPPEAYEYDEPGPRGSDNWIPPDTRRDHGWTRWHDEQDWPRWRDLGWPDEPEWHFEPYTHERALPDRAVPDRDDKVRPKERPAAAKARKSPARGETAHVPKVRRQAAQKRSHVDLARVLPRSAAVQISHSTATNLLRQAGLRMKSTGNCVSKHRHTCTSLESVRAGTVAKLLELKQQSGCPITVTGGTERGHAPGTYSHGNGYKIDISHNSCIDRHIAKHSHKTGVRGDGAKLYRSGSTVYADEGDHWDILFR
ncbi:hypothetical protein [Nonomuraea aridisoli]|uniref:Peptidase M15A C-terminal domain-containing protein n=1 Tax=Nonomuraea aridisoli TaxID=2070368 RepID=A0A2W2D8Y3_9ACTN|nr:hypothetical protein [Nonomuraea aridisoli]PZG07323.1 hypothetical protein C1J01_40940 [Nonomuraea aridisoli]